MCASADPYDVLGVLASSSADEVRRAYQRLVRQHHPDRSASGGGSSSSDGSAAFQRVQRAYDAVREPEARRRHDAQARAAAMAGAAAAARVLEVELSDMTFDDEGDVEEEAEGDENTDGGGGGEHGSVWRYDCRCGDEFVLSEAHLAEAVPCRSCSLVLKVVRPGGAAAALQPST